MLCASRRNFPFFKTTEGNYVKCSSTRDNEAEIPSLKPIAARYVMKSCSREFGPQNYVKNDLLY